MNKPNTACRVCGKKYFCCSDSREINSWRTMACSPNCFQEYMKRIEASRKPVAEITEAKTATKTKKKPTNTVDKIEDMISEAENIIEE